jgi:hypothetical protein
MSFLGHKIKAAQPTTVDKIPQEWFLTIADLNKPQIKDYMEESYRTKVLGQMIVNAVDEYKANKSNIRDFNDPQVRKAISDETANEQIKNAKAYAKSKAKTI